MPRDQYLRRMDLQLAGRTVMGKQPPRNQEVCDHCEFFFGSFVCAQIRINYSYDKLMKIYLA